MDSRTPNWKALSRAYIADERHCIIAMRPMGISLTCLWT